MTVRFVGVGWAAVGRRGQPTRELAREEAPSIARDTIVNNVVVVYGRQEKEKHRTWSTRPELE